jgi:hypothetical protein
MVISSCYLFIKHTGCKNTMKFQAEYSNPTLIFYREHNHLLFYTIFHLQYQHFSSIAELELKGAESFSCSQSRNRNAMQLWLRLRLRKHRYRYSCNFITFFNVFVITNVGIGTAYWSILGLEPEPEPEQHKMMLCNSAH